MKDLKFRAVTPVIAGRAFRTMSGEAVLVSLTRMNKIRHVDPANNTVTVEAGCVLQTLQETASGVGRLFRFAGAIPATAARLAETFDQREEKALEVVLPRARWMAAHLRWRRLRPETAFHRR